MDRSLKRLMRINRGRLKNLPLLIMPIGIYTEDLDQYALMTQYNI